MATVSTAGVVAPVVRACRRIVKRPIQGGSWKRDEGDRSEGKCKCRQRRQQSNQAGKAPPPSQGRCVVLDAGTVSAAKSQMEHQQAADLLSGLPTPTTVSVSSDSLRESILQISACFPIVFVCLYISLHSHVSLACWLPPCLPAFSAFLSFSTCSTTLY
jgi:hypothetical protein